MNKILIPILFFIITSSVYAQGEAAVPFLYSQQSPLYLGAGNIGVSNPIDEASGFYYNPSLLGYTSKVTHASFFSIPKQEIYSYVITPTFSNYGFNLGYNLKNSVLNLPFSIGLGFLHHRFSYGTFNITKPDDPTPIGKFESYDLFNSIGLGIGYDYILQFNLGIAIKFIDSQLSDQPTENESGTGSANITAFDYGASINIPLSYLLLSDIKYYLDDYSYISPEANLSMGMSLLNYGDEIKYIDDAQKDPLPRTARIGYTLNIGASININSDKFNLFNYFFSSESEDILIKRKGYGDHEYQTPFSDLHFIKNLIEQKDDTDIVVHRGQIISFFETIKLSSGIYKGRGFYDARKSYGYELSSNGVIKLLAMLIDNSTIHYMGNHIELKYYNCNMNTNTSYEYNFEGFSIMFKGFNL